MMPSKMIFAAAVLATLCCGSFGFTSFLTLTNVTHTDAGSEEVSDIGVPTKTGIRLSALKADLEYLRKLWLHNADKARPGRIQFIENRWTSIQILVWFSPKLYQDEYWQDDFLMIEPIGLSHYDTISIFHKSATFYAQTDYGFEPIPDDYFIPVQPIAVSLVGSISDPSSPIEVRYATLDMIAIPLRRDFDKQDSGRMYVKDLLVLPRETIETYYDETDKYYFKHNYILDGIHHSVVRLDRRKRAFYMEGDVPLDGRYFARTAHYKWQPNLGLNIMLQYSLENLMYNSSFKLPKLNFNDDRLSILDLGSFV